MTVSITPKRTRPVLAAAAALALAGCAGTNVGDSWQCPLAQGKVCASVAAADPAVPAPAAGGPVLPEPLYTRRDAPGAGAEDASPVPERPCDAACGGFDPLAWLATVFGADAETSPAGGAATATGQPAESDAQPAAAPLPGEPRSAEPPPDSRPIPPDIAAVEAAALPAPPDPAAGDLRTGEIVARIWIAPFVDADGVYREASHVRVVLEPAGWRVP